MFLKITTFPVTPRGRGVQGIRKTSLVSVLRGIVLRFSVFRLHPSPYLHFPSSSSEASRQAGFVLYAERAGWGQFVFAVNHHSTDQSTAFGPGARPANPKRVTQTKHSSTGKPSTLLTVTGTGLEQAFAALHVAALDYQCLPPTGATERV